MIRVLHVEDKPSDAELVALWLHEAGLDWEVVRVESREGFLSALDRGGFDIIVSDFSLPSFNGLEALGETRKRSSEVAFVFFTATLGEDRAVEALKAGATDFVAKERPGRLIPSLRRAVQESRERAARRNAEQTLRQSEASFRLLFDGNPHPMWVFDRETLRFLAVNAAAVEHYGFSRSEFLRMLITDIRPPEDVPTVIAAVKLEREADIARHSSEWRHRLKDGRVINVEIVADNLEFSGRPGRLVVAHDVTERKSLEAQLLQSQKLEAVGQLAAGVAHDFNNLLNVITGYSDLLLRREGRDETESARLGQIRRAAERGAGLTRQLLAFSRKQVIEPTALDLNVAMIAVQSMIERLIGEHIEVITSFDGGIGRVLADAGQMEQVVVNLAVNARDAMPDGGTLTFETTSVELDDPYVQAHPGARPGPHVRLSISDTGHGMDAATLARVFEPFFTTKPPGRGTGLGLATVHGIVRQSGGHVDVQSELGRGTSFEIYLPRVDEESALTPAQGQETLPGDGRGETVLLVEDDQALRSLIEEFLQENGYRVIGTADPAHALAAAQSNATRIDLVVTDLMLPQMTGGQLFLRIRELRPAIPVLLMSGHSDEAIGQPGLLGPRVHFLQKPFALTALLQKVRGTLDELER